MPLDPHSYLVSQGWEGKGTGLRAGAINRPLPALQKKTLSGLGKDRDEAFPFWDHVFSAAASAIKVCLDSDDENDGPSSTAVALNRTHTGILSNRRPPSGTPASTSGLSTPELEPESCTAAPRMSLMAIAKREAAKRGLYSRFFRGPVLGPDLGLEDEGLSAASTSGLSKSGGEEADGKKRTKRKECGDDDESTRKRRSQAHSSDAEEGTRRSRDEKQMRKAARAERRARKAARAEKRRRKQASTALASPALVKSDIPQEDSSDGPSPTSNPEDGSEQPKRKKRKSGPLNSRDTVFNPQVENPSANTVSPPEVRDSSLRASEEGTDDKRRKRNQHAVVSDI